MLHIFKSNEQLYFYKNTNKVYRGFCGLLCKAVLLLWRSTPLCWHKSFSFVCDDTSNWVLANPRCTLDWETASCHSKQCWCNMLERSQLFSPQKWGTICIWLVAVFYFDCMSYSCTVSLSWESHRVPGMEGLSVMLTLKLYAMFIGNYECLFIVHLWSLNFFIWKTVLRVWGVKRCNRSHCNG